MRYFLVTARHASHGAEKIYHGPFSSRAAVERAAITALSTSKFAQIQIEEDGKEKGKEDEDKEDGD